MRRHLVALSIAAATVLPAAAISPSPAAAVAVVEDSGDALVADLTYNADDRGFVADDRGVTEA
jgi:hypothetical protein